MQRPASPFVISNAVRHVAEHWYPILWVGPPCRFGCAVGVVASSTKAAPIIRLWAASDVVALDLPLVGAWWCCYRPAGLLPPVPGGFSADDREDLPGTRQVLELVAAAAFQPDGGVGDQVLDGAGDLMRCP